MEKVSVCIQMGSREFNKNPGICDHEPALCVTAVESCVYTGCVACAEGEVLCMSGFQAGLVPNLPVRLSVSWVLTEVVRYLGQRQDLFFMAQQSSMSFVLALVPQSRKSDTRVPGRCHASIGAVSQTAHTELLTASGQQACTWTTQINP